MGIEGGQAIENALRPASVPPPRVRYMSCEQQHDEWPTPAATRPPRRLSEFARVRARRTGWDSSMSRTSPDETPQSDRNDAATVSASHPRRRPHHHKRTPRRPLKRTQKRRVRDDRLIHGLHRRAREGRGAERDQRLRPERERIAEVTGDPERRGPAFAEAHDATPSPRRRLRPDRPVRIRLPGRLHRPVARSDFDRRALPAPVGRRRTRLWTSPTSFCAAAKRADVRKGWGKTFCAAR